jgi:hypothetical protein
VTFGDGTSRILNESNAKGPLDKDKIGKLKDILSELNEEENDIKVKSLYEQVF